MKKKVLLKSVAAVMSLFTLAPCFGNVAFATRKNKGKKDKVVKKQENLDSLTKEENEELIKLFKELQGTFNVLHNTQSEKQIKVAAKKTLFEFESMPQGLDEEVINTFLFKFEDETPTQLIYLNFLGKIDGYFNSFKIIWNESKKYPNQGLSRLDKFKLFMAFGFFLLEDF